MLSAPEKVFQGRKAITHHPDQSSIVEIQLQAKKLLGCSQTARCNPSSIFPSLVTLHCFICLQYFQN
jgi:hypothetical protein